MGLYLDESVSGRLVQKLLDALSTIPVGPDGTVDWQAAPAAKLQRTHDLAWALCDKIPAALHQLEAVLDSHEEIHGQTGQVAPAVFILVDLWAACQILAHEIKPFIEDYFVAPESEQEG
ncbi:hypothetical protein E8K88_16695 [Lampropedia aestuarii]|uniref:Uncharacterized protein n=1 Tax=Lampropedia aestuarii TaxID=2562762 RepID=A0A4S5BFV7_9BURK|nr:hypothetical protein [Lampropedia aestuarii]THJ30909.1 hypothetical protein E8K88_16695 [Lampropedia aestuarii]